MDKISTREGIGKIEIVFLGSGGGNSVVLGNTSALVQDPKNGENFVIDFGTGSATRCSNLEGNPPLSSIQGVIFTNTMLDYIGDIAILQYEVGSGLKLFIPDEFVAPFWNAVQNFFPTGNIDDYFDVIAIPPTVRDGTIVFQDTYSNSTHGGIEIEIFKNNNINGNQLSYGVYLEGEGYYSGVADFNPQVFNIYQPTATSVYLHSYSFVSSNNSATLLELSTLSDIIKAKMLLVQYQDYYDCMDFSEFKGLVIPYVT